MNRVKEVILLGELSIIGLVLGWSAVVFFSLSFSYSLLKRFPIIRSKINASTKKLLDYHCSLAIIATILASFHGMNNLINIEFAAEYELLFPTGYASLLLIILVTLIGILMKYYKKIIIKNKIFWLYTHVLLTVMLMGTILLHIFSYLLLQLQ